jgi:hypothetical protein
MKMTTIARKLKHFRVSCGRIGIGDPCYNTPTILSEAKNGKWVAHIEKSDEGSWGKRVARIIVHHEHFDPSVKLSKTEDLVPVDSGQAGVFDGNYDSNFEYENACRQTLGEQGYGFLNNAFVSSSGYGDGCYPCLIYKENKKSVCVEITFIEK